MVMVVFIHSYNIDIKQGGQILYFEKDANWIIQNFLSYGLTRIAVPLFFLISGYLFILDKKREFSDFLLKIKKRISTLMLPYLIWALLGLFFYFLLQGIPQSQSFFTKKFIKEYTFFEWINAIFNEPIPYQLWFLKDLIVMVILSPIIYFLVKNLKALFLFVIFCSWIFNQNSIFLTSEAILFFSSGMYIGLYKTEMLECKNDYKSLFIASWIVLLIAKTAIGFYSLNSILELMLLKASILIGIIAFWNGYDSIAYFKRENKKLNYIVSFSFFLYLFHEPFLTIVKKLLFSLLPKLPQFYLLVYFLAPLITILTALLLGSFLKYKMSSIYRFITGNR